MRTFEVALRVVKATLCSNLCVLLYELSVLKRQDQGRIQREQLTLPLHSSLSMSGGQVCSVIKRASESGSACRAVSVKRSMNCSK